MAFRDRPVDPRIIELEAQVASEPTLRSKSVPLQLEHDDVQARLVVMGSQLSEAAAELARRRGGGLQATLSSWLGRSLDEQVAGVARLENAIATATARLDELVAEQRELTVKISASVAARAELAALHERAFAALRHDLGPSGDELRALDSDDDRDAAQHAAIVRQIELVDLAQTAVHGVSTVLEDLAKLTGVASKISIVFDLLAWPFNTSQTTYEREQCRARFAGEIAETAIRLRAVLSTHDDTGCDWFATMPRARVLELAESRRAPLEAVETTPLAANAAALADSLFELATGLAEVRDRMARNTAERDARRRALVGSGA